MYSIKLIFTLAIVALMASVNAGGQSALNDQLINVYDAQTDRQQ